jgi:hypothetical protein
MKRLFLLATVVLVTLAAILGCQNPSSSTSTPATSTVYQFKQTTGSGVWPTVKLGIEPLSGKTISHLTMTYAVDANTLASGLWANWEYDSSSNWSPNLTLASTADAWTTTADVATSTFTTASSSGAAFPGASSFVSFDFGYASASACSAWVKQVNIAYSDASTETLTFTSSATTPVHSVVAGGATDAAFSSRFWTSDWTTTADLSSGLTQGVTTVSF